MTRRNALNLVCLVAVAGGCATASSAQIMSQTEPGAALLAEARNDPGASDWHVRVGAGLFYTPAFLGSDDYYLFGAPLVDVRYKDRFLVSLPEGIGFDLVKSQRFRAGPVVKYVGKRRSSGRNSFRIAGDRTTALIGLGGVGATAEAGGYAEYQLGKLAAKLELRQGIGGHDGLVGNFGASYTQAFPQLALADRPVVVSIGPRLTVVDDNYNQSYFSVDAVQSARSGLSQYDAGGGLQRYGVGGTIIVPLAPRITAAIIGEYERLTGDAGDSPLVRERGSRNQASVGLGLSYSFGL